MSIDRKANPSLREFRMITRKKNWIDFVPKQEEERNEEEILELLMDLKQEY
jgi:hypothetical protein